MPLLPRGTDLNRFPRRNSCRSFGATPISRQFDVLFASTGRTNCRYVTGHLYLSIYKALRHPMASSAFVERTFSLSNRVIEPGNTNAVRKLPSRAGDVVICDSSVSLPLNRQHAYRMLEATQDGCTCDQGESLFYQVGNCSCSVPKSWSWNRWPTRYVN